jgi:hypothetical protein
MLIGKRLLVGITIRDRDGAIIERRQFHGPVTEVADGVVVVAQQDGPDTMLPADPGAFEAARPGTYRLPSGVEVVNPDFLSTWEVVAGPDGAPPFR